MPRQPMRGSAPGRARDAHQRLGSFKRDHEKRGGRQRGTPNVFSVDYKKAILEAAYRIGYDGNGKYGVVGYFMWVAVYHARAYMFLLGHVLSLEALEIMVPAEPLPTVDQINERVRNCIGLGDGNLKHEARPRPGSSAEWTSQDFPLSSLMHAAVATPEHFCKLIAAAFLRAAGKRRRLTQPRW